MAAAAVTTDITLDQLLTGETGVPALPVSGIATDSRQLAPGYVFFACQGATSHGLDFVEQAVTAEASAIVWDANTGFATDVPVPTIAVPDLASKLGAIANCWFDTPTARLKLAGVTGTNGKTTIAYLIQQCMQRLEHKCAYVGTLGSGVDAVADDSQMTTPACFELHQKFADFRAQGADFAAMEVSSHALHQGRVDGIHFDTAIFTNLTRDHIDYHGGMRAYGEAKASLFIDFDVTQRVVNIDGDFGRDLAVRCPGDVILVSTTPLSDQGANHYVFSRDVISTESGSQLSVISSWGDLDIGLQLAGDFNVANALQVLATLLGWQVPLNDAARVLAQVSAPPGRLQRVNVAAAMADEKSGDLPAVYVDYSHTPASLEAALKSLRGYCKGQLWCVFGCGGDRDAGKRPMMGKASDDYADVSIVTSDNPRSEDPAAIIEEVLRGMGVETTSIANRSDAIAYAVANAGPDDVILIAGKGHEHYQVIGTERVRFSDAETAAENLTKRVRNGRTRS